MPVTEDPASQAVLLLAHPRKGTRSPFPPRLGEETAPTILVVDDDGGLRQLLALCLRRANYNVVCAANGRTALDLFRQQPIQLIILDLMMPEMDGLAVCDAIRLCSRVPILMLSAQSDPEVQAQALRRGVSGYLCKPMRLEELHRVIHALLTEDTTP